jgi:hypothetical protein
MTGAAYWSAMQVNYFARKHGLTAAEVREIIKQAGGNREKANQFAQKRPRNNAKKTVSIWCS